MRLMTEKNIVVWTVTDGITKEIKVDNQIYIPLTESDDVISYNDELWKRKFNNTLSRRYVKRKKYNMQNAFLKWFKKQKPGLVFVMDYFYKESGTSTGRPNRYNNILENLEHDGYLERIFEQGNKNYKYVVLKKFKS